LANSQTTNTTTPNDENEEDPIPIPAENDERTKIIGKNK